MNFNLENKKLKVSELDFLKTYFLSGTKKDKKGKETNYYVHTDLGMSDDDLKKFISNLEIDIDAGDIDQQGKDVIDIIKSNFNNCSNREAEYYYNNALKIIFKLATKGSLEERQITKEEFITVIDTKKFLFNKEHFCVLFIFTETARTFFRTFTEFPKKSFSNWKMYYQEYSKEICYESWLI